MPLKKLWLGPAAAMIAAFVLGPVGTASAAPVHASCAAGGSPVFQAFGDTSDYVLAPNGAFENGAAGWTLSGSAHAVADDDSLGFAAVGRGALELGPGATAVSPAFCVTAADPSFRYLVEGMTADANLRTLIQVVPAGAATARTTRTVRSADTPSPRAGVWSVSGSNPLATLLPFVRAGGTATVRIEFQATSGASKVADVYVDPWAKVAKPA